MPNVPGCFALLAIKHTHLASSLVLVLLLVVVLALMLVLVLLVLVVVLVFGVGVFEDLTVTETIVALLHSSQSGLSVQTKMRNRAMQLFRLKSRTMQCYVACESWYRQRIATMYKAQERE